MALVLENNLLDDFNRGSVDSYDTVFKLNYKKLCYFANSIIYDKIVAEDIVQDVFIRLWEKDKNFESFDKLSSFLFIAVKNNCINFINKRKFTDTVTDGNLIIESKDSVIDAIISAEMLSILNQAVDTLPTECKKIIHLVIKGYSSVEIAAVLNITPSSVRSQKARGVSLLKSKLHYNILHLFFIILKN